MRTYRSLRVAFYARVAVPHGPDSLANQIAALRQRMAADGGRLDAESAFIDDGYRGATLLRPALERLRQRAAQGALDRVYVAAPDRLARNNADHCRLLDECRCAAVDVVFLETNSPV